MAAEAVETVDVVEVLYCEGWDPAARAASAPMTEGEARRRDEMGEPYAVLLSHQGRPKALFHVDWRHAYLGLFFFDAHGRRTVEYVYRQLEPGRLHMSRFRQWGHTSDSEPEFPERGVRFELTVRPDGRGRRILNAGGALHVGADVPAEHRTVAKAEFGAWTTYVDARILGPSGGSVALVSVQPSEEGRASGAGASWSAPRPLEPGPLEELFVSGTRLTCGEDRIAVIGEPAPAGLLHLPTGSVLAGDPGTVNSSDLAFTITVPPGDYPVLVSTMRWEHEEWDGETPAAMLRILDEPTVSWELALRPEQDARLLGPGEFYGFGVDTGTACFMDASGRNTLPQLYEQEPGFEADSHSGMRSDPASGTNLIAFMSGFGDGSYPVWIGRDAAGAVTCFIADMLVLHGAEPQPPTVSSTAAHVLTFPALIDDRREAPFTDPAATSEFIAELIADIVSFRRERDAVRAARG
ncbi:DUF4241 domain-containing protein [Streptomyces katrae]|uniref:DUF4241 domain-containing protein n=1 Tax=Streptomyces katrae TaxID=68223 RepID=A0A0F4IVR8_9ACTN|nr:DUF4241 domain-containing protein [Streptomyces katrae]KJY26102.1 hypothetical protein VR44_30860 [Streptomyces katrae]